MSVLIIFIQKAIVQGICILYGATAYVCNLAVAVILSVGKLQNGDRKAMNTGLSHSACIIIQGI